MIKTKSVYKDYTGLLDTLRITDERATMTAWADTTHNILAGKLEEFTVYDFLIFNVYKCTFHFL